VAESEDLAHCSSASTCRCGEAVHAHYLVPVGLRAVPHAVATGIVPSPVRKLQDVPRGRVPNVERVVLVAAQDD
jgi:hypothetical protein